MNENVNLRKKKTRDWRLTLFQLLVAAGFLAALVFSFGQNVLGPRKQRAMPERLEHLYLVNMTEGAQALAQINRLHGTSINLVEAYIGQYAHQGEKVIIWVGKAGSAEDAAELTGRMIDGINKGGTDFSNLKEITVGNQKVFQAEGPDGKQLFFNSMKSREKVIWLTVTARDVMSFLPPVIDYF